MRAGSGRGTRRAACGARGSRPAGPTIARSADGGIGMPSISAASSVSSNVLPFSSACIRTEDWRVRRRLTTNAGASLTRTPRLPSFFVTSQAVASVDVVGGRGADELDEREHGDGVEEVHPDDTLRMLEVRRHLGDRERRGVRDEQALLRDDLLERAEDLLLDGDLLEHRLDHEVAAREAGGVGDAGRRSSRGSAPCPRPSRPRATCFSRSARIAATASSTRAASTSVITSGTSSRRRNSVASWVAIRPAPTTPTFWIRRGFASGIPTPFLIRRSIRSNA